MARKSKFAKVYIENGIIIVEFPDGETMSAEAWEAEAELWNSSVEQKIEECRARL